jgi:hypothetical protein
MTGMGAPESLKRTWDKTVSPEVDIQNKAQPMVAAQMAAPGCKCRNRFLPNGL